MLTALAPRPSGLSQIYSDEPPSWRLYGESRTPQEPRWWTNGITGFIVTGRLRSLHRLSVVLNHIEPKTKSLMVVKHHRPDRQAPSKHQVEFERRYPRELTSHSIQLAKFVNTQIRIDNVLSAHALHTILTLVDARKLSFKNIQHAIVTNDYSVVCFPGKERYVYNSPVPLFFLVLLYVISTSGSQRRARSANALLKTLSLRGVPHLNMSVPTPMLLAALLEKRVRFHNCPHATHPLRYQVGTMSFNERFETAELRDLTRRYRYERIANRVSQTLHGKSEGSFGGGLLGASQELTPRDRAEAAEANVPQMEQFQDSFMRMQDFYRSSSMHVVYSNLRFLAMHRLQLHPSLLSAGRVAFLVDFLERECVERHIFHGVGDVLSLLTQWALLIGDGLGSFAQPVLLRSVEVVSCVQDMLRVNATDPLYAGAVVFLCATTGVLPQDSPESKLICERVLDLLNEPNLISFSNLPQLLAGVQHLMVHASDVTFSTLCDAVMKLWGTNGPLGRTSYRLPRLRHGLLVFSLFRFAVTRRLSRKVNGLGSIQGWLPEWLSGKPPPYDGGPDWLTATAELCRVPQKTRHEDPALAYTALFALSGVVSGLGLFLQGWQVRAHEREASERILGQLGDVLAQCVSQVGARPIIGSAQRGFVSPTQQSRYTWRQAVGVAAAHSAQALPEQLRKAGAAELFVDLLLEDVYGLGWVLAGDVKLGRKAGEALHHHVSSRLFHQGLLLVRALAVVVQPWEAGGAIPDELLHRMEHFTRDTRQLVERSGKRIRGPELEAPLQQHLQSASLAITLFFSTAGPWLSPPQALRAIQTMSWLAFVRNPGGVSMHQPTQRALVQIVADDEEMMKSGDALKIIPVDMKLHEASQYDLKRLDFLLQGFRPILSKVPKDSLTRILPLCFALLTHQDAKVSATGHQVFQSLFSPRTPMGNIPHRGDHTYAHCMPDHIQQLVPEYIKTSLSLYPGILPFNAFAETTREALRGCPPNTELPLECFEILREKIIQMRANALPSYTPRPHEQAQGHSMLSSVDQDNAYASSQDPLSTPSLPPSKRAHIFQMSVFLCSLLGIVEISVLDELLHLIGDVVLSSVPTLQPMLCQVLHKQITSSYDYSRKDQCVGWYMELLTHLGLNKEVVLAKL